MSINTKDLATSLFKAFDTLSVLNANPEGVAIAVLARRLGFPRSSLVRMLDSLIYYGFVQRGADKTYRVTNAFREWRAETVEDSLIGRYRLLMRRISDEVGEMVVLGRLEGRRIRHLHCEEPNRRVRVAPPANRDFELGSMAMGKLAMSVRQDLIPRDSGRGFLREIEMAREEGCAWNRGESEPGILAWGTWLEAPSPLSPMLAVTWPDFRFTSEDLEKVKRILGK